MNYVSAAPLFAEVKEDLASYFNTGAIDDLMFDKWLSRCLNRFKNSSKIVKEQMMSVRNHKAELPEDFSSVKVLWLCHTHYSSFPSPTFTYYQKDCRITPITDRCEPCQQDEPYECDCDVCKRHENEFRVTHRLSGEFLFSYSHTDLLRPSSVALSFCENSCPNRHSSCGDTFDIQGCYLYTTIFDTNLHLIYYSNTTDEDGTPLVPDNDYVQKYIMDYIKYKIFEKLLNSTTDETFNQVRVKYEIAKQEMSESFTMAETDLKKWTRLQERDAVERDRNRFNKLIRRHY